MAPRLTVIAEAGVNHNGDVGRALQLVDAASECGADIVKFQAFRAASLVAAGTATAQYQAANTGERQQQDLLKGLELPMSSFRQIAQRCRERQIGFLCTAFDDDMLDELVPLGMPAIKVASGEMTNSCALERLARHRLPVLLSTGMATLDEVQRAVETLKGAGVPDITLLHCTSLYPAPTNTINLRAMVSMREACGLPVGYSDHSTGDHVAVAAVALGACVIEKHFTLDRTLPGPDHAASLEPSDFNWMVKRLHETAAALGDGVKRPTAAEAETASLVRRSWHAARDLAAGAVLRPADIVLKRPADGLAPFESPIGRTLAVARSADAPIRAVDLRQ